MAKQILRSEVKPGQKFAFSDPGTLTDLPCIATDALTDSKIKKSRNGGAGFVWHLYTPTGNLSWSRPDTGVWVSE